MVNLRDAVVEMVRDVCRPDPVDLSDHARPLLDSGLDSLDFASVLMAIEDRFNVVVAEEDLEQLGTIDKIVHYVEERSGA